MTLGFLACTPHHILGQCIKKHASYNSYLLKLDRLPIYLITMINIQYPVVYWLGHPTLVRAMAGSNPIRNPLLPAKAVDRQPSDDRFERTTRWVPCADGIKLQSLRSVRFWTSLVRICLDLFRSNRTLIGIGDWHSFLVRSPS